ncbi:hypothetical protein GCM10010307_34060 [Streptomyces vastus]|uniref:5'-nucleotidase n=1 Tax=Streptomyces vastus TaxID=285451 RepID=A0ABP6D8N8_9ACTN
MHKRMLRSALAAAFSAVVAFGVLSGLDGTKVDARAGDSSWSVNAAPAADPGDSSWVSPASTGGDDDSSWSGDDSSWAVES